MPTDDRSSRGSLQGFVAELRERSVFRIAGVYVQGAWLLIQVAEATFEALLIPPWVNTALILILLAGFPLAVILAWVFEITPSGIVRDAPAGARSRLLDLALLSALLLVVGFVSYRLLLHVQDIRSVDSEPPSTAAPAENSIGVLPFVNIGAARDSDYFSDGLAEEILNRLASIGELQVASRTATFYFKDKDYDLPTIADRVGVRYLLEGSVRRDGERVRVSAQLVDASTGFRLWSEVYDRLLEDIFGIQDDIALRVVDSLEIMLSEEAGRRLGRQPTESVDAYDYYLQGRDYLNRPRSDEVLAAAESLFEKAIALDADYAEAHAGLCDTYLARYELRRSTAWFEAAEEACGVALALDSPADAVHVALGQLYRLSGQYERAIEEFRSAAAIRPDSVDAFRGLAETYQQADEPGLAEQAYRRAIEIRPRFARSHVMLGNFLLMSGRPQEAIPHLRYVTRVMPENAPALNSLGAASFMAGRLDDAIAAWQRSLEVSPTRGAYSNLGSGYFYLDRYDEALPMYREAIAMAPDDHRLWGNLADAYQALEPGGDAALAAYRKAADLADAALEINELDVDALAGLARYHARLGDSAVALDYADRALKLAPEDMYVWYDAAVAYAALGRGEQALGAARRAVALGFPGSILTKDAGLRPLRDYEDFVALAASESMEEQEGGI